jgi:hypothetical protein
VSASVAPIQEYAVELEVQLDMICRECDARLNATDDIRKQDEGEAPWGKWAIRHAIASKEAGWFLRASGSDSSGPHCLCPDCASKRGISVQIEEEERRLTSY